MSDFTPTTEQVKALLLEQGRLGPHELDRWLAEHDREVIRTYAETLQMGRRRDALLYAERLSTDAGPKLGGIPGLTEAEAEAYSEAIRKSDGSDT